MEQLIQLIQALLPDPPTALLVIFTAGAVVAFAKGFIVPKPIYDREAKRADKADETTAAMLESQRNMTQAFKDLTTEVLRK